MRLFEKGEMSFVFLWVLNPIVILFYQNCAPSQLSVASTDGPRDPASVNASAAEAANPACSPSQKTFCPRPSL